MLQELLDAAGKRRVTPKPSLVVGTIGSAQEQCCYGCSLPAPADGAGSRSTSDG